MRKILKFVCFVFLLFIISSCSSNDDVKIVDIKLTDEEYAFVVKKGNNTLVNDFNNFLDEIKENGEFNKIVKKYFEGVGRIKDSRKYDSVYQEKEDYKSRCEKVSQVIDDMLTENDTSSIIKNGIEAWYKKYLC